MKTLSIVIPAYNEENFIGKLLDIILEVPTESLGFQKEIVVVDDGSADKTSEIVTKYPQVKLIRQQNQGKGAAVQNGVRNSTGDFVLVQDADLEYSPHDYILMLTKLNENFNSAVYGSRTRGVAASKSGYRFFPGRHKDQGFGPWFAGAVLTLWTFILYQRWITDTLTAYKIYPRDFLKGIKVKTTGFETDHEITSKLIKGGIAIFEVPIEYKPRSLAEGKKIGMRDGFIALWVLLRFRFAN